MNESLKDGFRLGELLVQPRRGLVVDRDASRHLSPKAAAILLCLASRPNEIVSRSELLASAWGEGRGSHEALRHAVSALRTALDDHRDDSRVIETVPRRGYRLLVEPQPPVPGSGREPSGEAVVDATREPDFLGELKRRGVVETGLAYLVIGWLLIQVADVTFDQLLLPRWLGTFVTVLVIAGFPIALVLAWFIEIVEGRAVLDRDAPRRKKSGNVVSRTYTAILGALLLAATGVFTFDHFVGLPQEADAIAGAGDGDIALETPVDPNGIAILPFLNIDGGEEARIFAEGLTEDLISRLGKVPSLRVSSRHDSVSLPPYAGSADVRRRLRVSYYLEGSVRVIGERLRVVIKLIDSANGFHLLSNSFDGDRGEFFAIQDEIATRTVANLRPALPPETRAVPDSLTANENLDAYVLYRRGMDALHKSVTAATIREALDWFDQALAVDPAYAAAYAGKCATYVEGFDVSVDRDLIDRAEQSCDAALARNPNLDVVHVALGDLYWRTGQLRLAEGSYERALIINGNNVEALTGLAAVYHEGQRSDEAEEKYRQAVGSQPGNWRTYNALGTFLFRLGRYDEAAENYRRVISLDSGNPQGYDNLGAALMLSGNFAGAAPAFARSIEIEPTRTAYSNLGMLYYYLGDLDRSVAAHEKAAELAPNDHLTWSNLGDALSFSEETDRARAAFRRAEELAESKLAVNATDAETMIELAWIKAMLGKRQEALDLIEPAKRMKSQDPYVRFISGLVLVKAEETTRAYEDLEAAIEMGFPRQMLSAEPHLRTLRGESRYMALAESKAVR